MRISIRLCATVTLPFVSFVTSAAAADDTAPLIQPNIVGTLGDAGWYVSEVEVSWTVTDAESPIYEMHGCDRVKVTDDTSGTTFTCTAMSAGGRASQSVSIRKDSAPPTIRIASPSDGIGFYTGQVVSADFGCEDSGSGVASCAGTVVAGAPLNTGSIGDNQFQVTARDQAGIALSLARKYTVVEGRRTCGGSYRSVGLKIDSPETADP
jgi:hypothetical protein